MSGKRRKNVMLLGGLLFFFQICSQLGSQGSMNSPCYISLDQHTCTPSPLLIPLSLRMYMCKNTYTQQFMKHTVFSTSIYTCVSISLHPKAPGDSCECTAQIWAHTHRATRLPCTAMFLTLLSGVTWMISSPLFYHQALTPYRNGYCFSQFLSHMTWPSWWHFSGAVWLLLSPGPSLLLLKDHSHRTPGLNKTFTMLE